MMNGSPLNLAVLVASLGLATWGASWRQEAQAPVMVSDEAAKGEASYPETLRDARGFEVKTGAYQRIVSLDPEASRLLLSLVSLRRLAGVSDYAKHQHPWGFRFSESKTVKSSKNLEEILSLDPDLVLVTPLSDSASVARLRELGVAVFDLGGVQGVEKSLQDLGRLGQLLHQGVRARQAASAMRQQRQGLRAQLRGWSPVPGIYLSRYGDKFYGGTTGTSYADLLALAGVKDLAAAAGYKKWPSYRVEELWKLDPPWIITTVGQAKTLCRHPGLVRLRACLSPDRVVELPSGLESDSGAGLLSAAAELHQRLRQGREDLVAEPQVTW